jgi:hypothetical protein
MQPGAAIADMVAACQRLESTGYTCFFDANIDNGWMGRKLCHPDESPLSLGGGI